MLLVHRVDRLCRSVRALAQLLEELDQAGVSFRSATEPLPAITEAAIPTSEKAIHWQVRGVRGAVQGPLSSWVWECIRLPLMPYRYLRPSRPAVSGRTIPPTRLPHRR